MNKDIKNSRPGDEQAAAKKLQSIAGDMHISNAFQSRLEAKLIEAHRERSQGGQGWLARNLPALGWGITALIALFIMNWAISSLIPKSSPGANEAASPGNLFEYEVKTGNICKGPLAAGHGFSVFLTNEDKTGFLKLDEQKSIGELRSFSWSPDGQQLAVVGNTRGSGNLYLLKSGSSQLQQVFSSSELGYLYGVEWSPDGKQLLTWEISNNTAVYFVDTEGPVLVKKSLGLQFFETPKYARDNESILFYGAGQSSGLFLANPGAGQAEMISGLVENEGSFAWSHDGSRLAYIEMDRNAGEARLVVEDQSGKAVIASLPIPKGSGSSIPGSANLSWAPDEKTIVFEFGRYAADRSIYLAYADGTGLFKVAEAAHAPAISGDGRCLAYISGNQVFLWDLGGNTSSKISAAEPLLLAGLPAGQGTVDVRLDKLQWKPE